MCVSAWCVCVNLNINIELILQQQTIQWFTNRKVKQIRPLFTAHPSNKYLVSKLWMLTYKMWASGWAIQILASNITYQSQQGRTSRLSSHCPTSHKSTPVAGVRQFSSRDTMQHCHPTGAVSRKKIPVCWSTWTQLVNSAPCQLQLLSYQFYGARSHKRGQ